jgi:hypothetical protein
MEMERIVVPGQLGQKVRDSISINKSGVVVHTYNPI